MSSIYTITAIAACDDPLNYEKWTVVCYKNEKMAKKHLSLLEKEFDKFWDRFKPITIYGIFKNRYDPTEKIIDMDFYDDIQYSIEVSVLFDRNSFKAFENSIVLKELING